jgi:hypothetical protein
MRVCKHVLLSLSLSHTHTISLFLTLSPCPRPPRRGGGGAHGGGGRGEVKCSAAKLLAAAAKPLAGGVTNVPVPKCPTHARECRIKRVHKQGANKGRLFFSCNVPSCKFFQWGDVWFPKCSSHPQRPSVLRCAQRERESARAREREFIRIDTP